jgi:tRNA A-37 threonylcarbamoyl transferase component Bud32
MSSSDFERWFDSFREGLRRDEAERAGTPAREPALTHSPPDLPRYEIGERLGEGAAAVVYRAWDRELGRPVALKVLRDTADVRRTLRARFHREAKIAAGLDHPNIVRVYDLGEVDGRLFMVMELVEGSSLDARLSDPSTPLGEKLRLLEKAARGVAHAHARGVIHRDLKPANILVDRAGEPKVGDFGISLGLDSEPRLTRTGEPLGTPAYMAPEQVRGDGDPTVRTDVYALGTILYEILAGRPPHGAGSLPELYRKILDEDPAPPRSPSAATAVALKALSKDPAGRYADAGDFADDLSRVLRGEPARARRPGVLRRWGRTLRARPAATAALAAAAAFGLGALAAATVPGTADRNRAALRAAVVRAFDREKARLDERYKGLQPVRLVAALQAATERGTDATPPEEIRDLLDYELKKLRVEPDLLAVLPPRGRAVYARGPSAALAALDDRRPAPGPAFAAAEGRLWLLDGAEVRDTAPEHDDVVRGYRWIGAPIDAAALSGAIPADAGLVAWTGPDRRVLAGASFAPADADRGPVRVGARSLVDFSEPLPGAVLPVRQHLLVEARGPREGFLLGASIACAASLAAALLLLRRAR